jgi:hypothetical protein
MFRWPRFLRRFRRRPVVVVVDANAYARMCALAVVGEAWEIVVAEEQRWLNLDAEPPE